MPDTIAGQLKLNRAVRLHTRFCFHRFFGELTFVVGTRGVRQIPEFYIDTLNLVVEASDETGGGPSTPSACLPGGTKPKVKFDRRSRKIASEFEMNIDFPAARKADRSERNPKIDTPGPTCVRTKAILEGRFLNDLKPREFGSQNLEFQLRIDVPREIVERLRIKPTIELVHFIPIYWLYAIPRKELCIQPVFISPNGGTPATGEDFYPLLARANEIWSKCCIRFTAKCPKYVDKQEFRVSTTAEAIAFKDEVDVADAIEVFVVERLDPEDTWGGGATFASGTATAKVVTGDNQLPLNQNHLAHEMGHVLGLGHPANPNGLIAGCPGSLLEPSGFFADNPEFQCEANCKNASNPLLNTVPFAYCLSTVNRPDNELF